MLEQIIIGLVFLAALAFLGRRGWKSFFTRKDGCAKGCGCDTAAPARTNQQSDKASVW
ncbi:FeoB-associated Cys-rich membrane protein [Nibrella saemangeumensis]|uniref:FeoB-associated Cys-rich membrane protein n=1 Tax=Nibrella saemangeumensis TaxID=1084526 RepID=UPI0031E77613